MYVMPCIWSVIPWRIHLPYTITAGKKEQKVMHTYIRTYVRKVHVVKMFTVARIPYYIWVVCCVLVVVCPVLQR